MSARRAAQEGLADFGIRFMRRPGETGCERRGENDASSDDSPSEEEIGLLVVDNDCCCCCSEVLRRHMAHRLSTSFINILYNLGKWLFYILYIFLLSFLFLIFSHFLIFLAHRLFFLFFSFFSHLVYVFFSLSKVTRMIGVPLVAKQGSFVIFF